MKTFFGIDGGGTHCRLSLMTEKGEALFSVSGGPTNIYGCKKETVLQNLTDLFIGLEKDSDYSIFDCSAGCFASAGLETDEEKAFFADFFCRLIKKRETESGKKCVLRPDSVYFLNDAYAALTGALGKSQGFLLISGTGSIACGMQRDGRTVRAGGLGHFLSDGGSGFDIGLQGLRAAACFADKMPFCGGPGSEKLLHAAFSHYGISNVRQLFSFLYTDFDKAKVASFAPFVFDAAEDASRPDPVAAQILERAAESLAELCFCVYSKMPGILFPELAFSGSILEKELDFSRFVAHKIADRLPDLAIVGKKYGSSEGACIYAINRFKC